LLKEPLDAAGIAYQYLDGSTPAEGDAAALPSTDDLLALIRGE
jgi:hypothetical protein